MATSQYTLHQIPSGKQLQNTLHRFAMHLYAQRGAAETTVQLMTGFVRRLAPVIGLRPKPAQVQAYIADLRRSGASYAHVANTISALTRYMDFIGCPVLLKRPRKPRRVIMNTMTEAEIAIIIHNADDLRQRAILTLLAYSGARNRELCALRIRDIDLSGQFLLIEVAKGESQRRICIGGACVEVLTTYLRERDAHPDDLLFVTKRHGHQLQPQDIRKIIRVAAKRAGIDKRVYPHLFRHSLATNMLHRGANLMTIKEQLGHVYIDTTMVYLHSMPERLQADYRAFAPSYL